MIYHLIMVFSCRSVTLVGEKERKMLKEIVKKARNPVKSRVVPQGEVLLHVHVPVKLYCSLQ